MREYLQLIKTVLAKGERRKNRTGIDTIACFGLHYKVDLNSGFPLLTTKKVNFDAVLYELLWFLSGETHIRRLRRQTKIWDAWTSAEKNWSLGNTYGYQWTKWEQYLQNPASGAVRIRHVNQIQKVIDDLKTKIGRAHV